MRRFEIYFLGLETLSESTCVYTVVVVQAMMKQERDRIYYFLELKMRSRIPYPDMMKC
ncbi:MAG: hypothetical protein HC939_05060 [Pleurocapsa sp. SU_5_0]|nr:hypothetical protein [Pleurocapsa sp. SU_5_0]NJO95103.1 hypothetical protein [Pleurocapsa sp. CRU_1_2]